MVFGDREASGITVSDKYFLRYLRLLYLVTFFVNWHIGPAFCRKAVLLSCFIEKILLKH